MKKTRIVILLASDITVEQRVNKEINSLIIAGNEITLIDMPGAGAKEYCGEARHVPIRLYSRKMPKNPVFWLIKYLEYIFRAIFLCVSLRPDYIHCVDRLSLMPSGIASAITRVPLTYDSQEIWPEVMGIGNKPRFLWLMLERFFAKRARRVLVTDKFRRDITAELLQLDKDKISCLMNVPLLRAMVPAKSDIRADSGFQDDVVLVYAGNLAPSRHLEDIVLSLKFLDPKHKLVIMGFGEKKYSGSLLALAYGNGVGDRVKLLSPVKWNELSSYMAGANCSFALYEKNSINNIYCSPSKIFDSFLAGVPVVTTDNPLLMDMASGNEAIECLGDVNARSIATAVQKLLARFNSEKQRDELISLASRDFTWEAQEELLGTLYGP